MRRLSIAAVLCGLVLSAGCASQKGPGSSDEAVSLSHPPKPVAFSAPRPGLSIVGNDYLFAAPVTVNRQGSPKNYLWFALGSTTDRVLTNTPEPTFDSIVLVVDGVPMTFDLMRWSEASGAEPYDVGVYERAAYAARVTRSQVRRIAAATQLEAYVTNDEHRSPTYVLADGELGGWERF
ncbi:MAG: hypothetical protein AAFX10_08035 [Pseudomonadota bacterium]